MGILGGVVNLPRWSKLHQIPERSFREIWHEKTIYPPSEPRLCLSARLWWPSRSWRMLKEPSGHDTVDGSEILRSPIEVGSLATSMCNSLYIQAVVVWDFWPINSTWGRDSLDTFHWFYRKAHLDTFQFVEKAVVLFICPFQGPKKHHFCWWSQTLNYPMLRYLQNTVTNGLPSVSLCVKKSPGASKKRCDQNPYIVVLH